MSISYQFGDVDAHGALIRSQAASLEAEHQSIVRDVLAAGDFWGGSGSVACQEFITQLGRNFQVIYEQANSHGQKVQTAGNNMCVHRQRRRLQLGLTLPNSANIVGAMQFAAPEATDVSVLVTLFTLSASRTRSSRIGICQVYPRRQEIPPVPANLDGNPRSKELPWKGLPGRWPRSPAPVRASVRRWPSSWPARAPRWRSATSTPRGSRRPKNS